MAEPGSHQTVQHDELFDYEPGNSDRNDVDIDELFARTRKLVRLSMFAVQGVLADSEYIGTAIEDEDVRLIEEIARVTDYYMRRLEDVYRERNAPEGGTPAVEPGDA